MAEAYQEDLDFCFFIITMIIRGKNVNASLAILRYAISSVLLPGASRGLWKAGAKKPGLTKGKAHYSHRTSKTLLPGQSIKIMDHAFWIGAGEIGTTLQCYVSFLRRFRNRVGTVSGTVPEIHSKFGQL